MGLYPNADGNYRMTVFSGYNVDLYTESATPRYKQKYVWNADYSRVAVDVNDCLKVRREWLFFSILDSSLPSQSRLN